MDYLVSIITPGWNGVNFVHRLLDSIIIQTYKKIQYIYIDDGSTDGTKDVVLSYQSKFEEIGMSFIFISQENAGVTAALNTGLQYVKGDYLCWPEYDDFLTPDSIEKKLNYLLKHPNCAVVTSDAWLIYEDNISEKKGVLSNYNPNRFDKNHFIPLIMSNSIFTAGCHMVRMDLFDETHLNRSLFPSKNRAKLANVVAIIL